MSEQSAGRRRARSEARCAEPTAYTGHHIIPHPARDAGSNTRYVRTAHRIAHTHPMRYLSTAHCVDPRYVSTRHYIATCALSVPDVA
eukprot:2587649-Rhodomonas_salina.2